MFCCLFPSVLIPLFSWLSLVWPCITETFSLTVHERLHLGDWHGGAGCRFGRIGLWVRVSGEAAQGADVQRVGGLDHGEVLLRHRHHLDLRGVRFLWSFCLKFLERTTERRSIRQMIGSMSCFSCCLDWKWSEVIRTDWVQRTTDTPWLLVLLD